MSRLAKTSSRRMQLLPWVARLSNDWFPWRFSWRTSRLRARIAGLWVGDLWAFRRAPVIRPKRRTVTLDIDQLDRRQSPTSIVAVDPVTAHLVSFAAMQEPLPPLFKSPNPPTSMRARLGQRLPFHLPRPSGGE